MSLVDLVWPRDKMRAVAAAREARDVVTRPGVEVTLALRASNAVGEARLELMQALYRRIVAMAVVSVVAMVVAWMVVLL